jgi:xanthine dehydrogenase accessory factor
MIAAQLSGEVQRLIEAQEPFVLATVVRARRPTSVRPGYAAVVHRDGSIEGFVGGVWTTPTEMTPMRRRERSWSTTHA